MSTPSTPLHTIAMLLREAQTFVNAGRLKEAAATLQQILAFEPAHPVALNAMAEIALRQGYFDAAWKLAYQAVQKTPAIDNFLLLARIARAMGNLDEAINWYIAVLKDFPDNTAALTHLGQIYSEAGYRTRAIEYCERAQALMPGNFLYLRSVSKLYPFSSIERVCRLYERARPPANQSFDQRLFFQSQFIAVKEATERARHGLSSQAHSLRDLFFHFATDELDVLEGMSDAALAENPKLLMALASKAACALARGNSLESEKFFHACIELDPNGLYETVMFDTAFFERLDALDEASLFSDLPNVVDVLSPSFANAPIIFLSCDTKYFYQFARPLLLSLNNVAVGVQVHVHVMNATGESVAPAKIFCEALTNIKVAMSTEDVASRIKDQTSARNYFHAIRFTRMLQYLMHYRKPLWLLDVDALMNRDPRPMFESVGDGDIALYGHAGRLEPWVQFNASIVGIQPRVRGIKYLKLVSAYINYFYTRDKLRWGIDQLAMYGVFNFLKNAAEPFEIRFVPDGVLDGEYTPEGIIWNNGTAAKFTTAKVLADPANGLPDSPRIRYSKALDKYAAHLQ